MLHKWILVKFNLNLAMKPQRKYFLQALGNVLNFNEIKNISLFN